MMFHGHSRPRSLELSSNQNGIPVLDSALMNDILIEAALNRSLSEAMVNSALSSECVPVSPENALEIADSFSRRLALLREALVIVERRLSQLPSDERLDHVHKALSHSVVTLTSSIKNVHDPVNILRALHTWPELEVAPEFVSAILGIRDERIGGDIERYSRHQLLAEYAQGGFMYQPSEIVDIWPLFAHLSFKPGCVFYDLGSGYGHSLFYGAALRPDISFRGIEIMSARVDESRAALARLGMENVTFEAGDASKGGFSDADVIFVYNPFPPDTQVEVAERIEEIAAAKSVVVVDYLGIVSQGVPSLCAIPFMSLTPYRLAASRRFLKESRALVGLPATPSS